MRIVTRLSIATVALTLTAWLVALTGPAQIQVANAQNKPVPQTSPDRPMPVAIPLDQVPLYPNLPGVKQAPEQIPVYTLPEIDRTFVNVVRDFEAKGETSWNNALLNTPEAWKKTKGKGIKVYVLDTGVDASHPDLKDRVKGVKDFSGSRFGAADKQGHGTHCCGIVAASGDLVGVAPEADLHMGKVLGDDGSGAVTWIANGIKWAADEDADVISMSLGGSGADSYIPPALAIADAKGVIVVAAAGNEGPGNNTDGYPARYPQCISVAACDKNKAIANFSSRGKSVWTTAPGVAIRSTYPGGQYAGLSGTSMATPHVAGVAALWCAANPQIPKKDRPAKFRQWLKDVGSVATRTDATGYGLPDAGKINDGGGPVVPPITPPTPGYNFTISHTDLLAAKRAELEANGIKNFKLEIGTGSPVKPAPIPVPIDPPPQPMPIPAPAPSRCIGPGCVNQQDSGRWEPFGGRFRIFK